MITRHFGSPRGALGRLVGRVMARSNAGFNRWVVKQLDEGSQGAPGRLVLLQGDTFYLANLPPLDLVLAVHVLYFWHRPEVELDRIRSALRPGGALALGYRLREHMPRISQTRFPKEGHLLYESDQEVAELLDSAGFQSVEQRLADNAPDAHAGRLAIATA